jgi:protein-tyrosine phosphatase
VTADQVIGAAAALDRPHVLFVCTGNLCRSPIGAALLVQELDRSGIEADVDSVGLGAPLGRPVDRKLRRVADELGVDVSGHASTPVTREHLRWADLILTMTGEHTAHVRTLDPSTQDRVTTLRAAAWRARLLASRPMRFGEWVRVLTADMAPAERATRDTAYDIADPIGGPYREYRAMGDEVQGLVGSLVERWSGR